MEKISEILKEKKEQLKKTFKKERVVLAYLFGSAAKRQITPLSDIDIAVLFLEKVKKEDYFDKRLKIASEIDRILNIYKTEVICLNEAPPLLKHRAVFNGISIFNSNSKLKRDFELRVLQEYEDFKYHLETGYKIMERHIRKGTFGKAPLVSKYGY